MDFERILKKHYFIVRSSSSLQWHSNFQKRMVSTETIHGNMLSINFLLLGECPTGEADYHEICGRSYFFVQQNISHALRVQTHL